MNHKIEILNDWAKTTKDGSPGISVRQHCHAVKSVVSELLRCFPLFLQEHEISDDAIKFLALSHDVGKISIDFLQHCKKWMQDQNFTIISQNEDWSSIYKRWHPKISQDSLQIFLQNKGFDPQTAYLWAAVIGAHHGSLQEKPLKLKNYDKKWEEKRQACLSEFWDECGQPKLPKVDKNNEQLWIIAGLITLSDWIGSDEDFFPADKNLSLEELSQAAKNAITAIGLGSPEIKPNLGFSDLFQAKQAYPMQLACANAIVRPGIYILEAPMGMGKTEAALLAAYNLLKNNQAQGLFFALPTQATSNRMYLRLDEFLKRISTNQVSTQLIHGNSWLCDDLKALASQGSIDAPKNMAAQLPDYLWFNSPRRALFAPYGVGTIDQLLLSVLAVKHFPLRRFALSRKVIILDEVHTYDIYTGTIIKHMCSVLEKLQCTVIILSATLTESVRKSILEEPSYKEDSNLAPYPRLTGRVEGRSITPQTPPPPSNKKINIIHHSFEEAQKKAIEFAKKGAQILWVCDTVNSAQTTYSAFKKIIGNQFSLGLLHSRFPFFKRDQIENTWLNRFGVAGERSDGAILISTQIVEQSVDLDADILFSELAPTDMLLQRLGRLWRHKRNHRPISAPLFCLLKETVDLQDLRTMDVENIKRSLGKKALVYNPYVLLRTLEQWNDLESLNLPQDIRFLIAATYDDKECPSAWEEIGLEKIGKELADKTLAKMATNIWQPLLNDSTQVKTRLGDHKDYTFVLCTQDQENELTLLEKNTLVRLENTDLIKVAKALHRNTIKLSEFWFENNTKDPRLQHYHIDGRLLILEKNINAPNLKQNVKLSWDDELGLVIE